MSYCQINILNFCRQNKYPANEWWWWRFRRSENQKVDKWKSWSAWGLHCQSIKMRFYFRYFFFFRCVVFTHLPKNTHSLSYTNKRRKKVKSTSWAEVLKCVLEIRINIQVILCTMAASFNIFYLSKSNLIGKNHWKLFGHCNGKFNIDSNTIQLCSA